jgi:GNAT superfamily N-acetyltransferase
VSHARFVDPVATTTRTANLADADAISELTRQLGYSADATEMRSRLERLLVRNDTAVWVAEDASHAVLGWLQVTIGDSVESGRRAEIVGLVVADNARRRGVGRSLVAVAEEWAAGRGVSVIGVRSNLTRVESHAFYQTLGYAHTKSQAVYRKALC